ncbi:DNA-binding transcriptional regulator, XRE-family HTH domain [Plantibacter flavus]|uniref:DNA-binding XRE family transcriptional regulator n=1 Tax=Plantibacter flavus TaxID=150123 RepID=A0A3N2C1C4_9MICO|nr:helix-turn-helix transcriptional regulator [Plantibacter flavus]ROR81104.1 DNA-binding XRE family transcriptional regulator [Plantibacter flavus]SMG07924.1 DNA-binding transcriptional regulator, XRE-family HTH domain [Plantibacter flavus]
MTTTRKLNGPAVRVIRDLTGIRAGAFAKRIEIDAGYLTKIEQGTRQPSVEVMRKIADSLGIPLEAITYPVAVAEPVAA